MQSREQKALSSHNGILKEESSSSSLVAQSRNGHNCTNLASSLKHQERLECQVLPLWARRRELDRCLKLPLVSRHTNTWHLNVTVLTVNELLSQDKVKTEYKKSPASRDLPVPVYCPISWEPYSSQWLYPPVSSFTLYPVQGLHNSARWSPAKLLPGRGVNR